ncbi:QcrA and Rieske domain-containing protein [Blastopirellula marina]|uniref:Menaquinol-cytochrome c reductase iron-sulfur subunit n=1 Tax=Blastopirellula marina DSM 3645 TaxID=314230 RepID=A3ZQU2_9BACT|nr:Rieske 2Fe-2S domain-containing protein [Blastopirellula marina]EAQ81032.1 menaquinol-cytochrome c reductase iron-sulfur subunit [Blastopirellula marina DSM 3645]
MTHETDPSLPDERRSFLTKAAAIIIGGFVGFVPFAAGLATFLDPVFRKSNASKLLKIAALDSLPADGVPRQFPVVSDQTDAWNQNRNQPIGAVYLRRMPDSETIEAFNAACPHAGCAVDFKPSAGEAGLFQCPCHKSEFNPDGVRLDPETCPSPRDLDPLPVDAEKLKQGEVWVEFMNFQTGPARKPIT